MLAKALFCYAVLVAVCSATLCYKRHTPRPNIRGDYDFIIAGGGTAGAIVAARLASANFCVLVIESGYKLYDEPDLSSELVVPVITGTSLLDDTIGSLLPIFQNLQTMPFIYPYVAMTNASHYYLTVPQIYAQKREIDYPRGNMIGGSSGANALIFFRGSVRDFDSWENDYDLDGWGFDDVMPYFKKFENNEAILNSPIHGYGGPINITLTRDQYPSPPTDAWTRAAEKIGYSKILDASDPRTVYGASDSWQTFVGNSRHRSDSSAYIRIMDQQGKVCWNQPREKCSPHHNLIIWTNTHVTKVLTDDKRAYGVEYAQGVSLDRTEHPSMPRSETESKKHHKPYNKWDKRNQEGAERLGAPVDRDLAYDWGRPYDQYIPETSTKYTPQTVTAKYEVILAAGTIATPQLLMLSGIGPKEHLREHGITLVQDLPVGSHTNDHQEVFVQWLFGSKYKTPFSFATEALRGFPELKKFQMGQPGFYSSNQIAGGLDGSSAGPNGTIPTWHMHHVVGGAYENADYNLCSYPETIDPLYRVPRSFGELLLTQGFRIHIHICELSSNHAHGTIRLRNTDPFVPPFVDPRYASSREDIAELVHCVKTVRELMANTEDKQFAGQELEPSASAKTDEQITQFIRNHVWGHHISSAAPMGECGSDYAVTDGSGRVYGVEALRVVDISVFPTIPHGNPAGVVMMVAEKLAEQILKDYHVPIPTSL